MLFQTSELANKAEISILSARDTTRARVPGRGIMGRNEGVYKNGYNTCLSSRLQNQPRSFRFVLINFFCFFFVQFFLFQVPCTQSGRIGCSNFIFVKPSQDGLQIAWRLSHGSYPDFLHIFLHRGFLWQVSSGLRSNRICFVSGCSALLGFLFVFFFFVLQVSIAIYLHCTQELMIPSLTGSLTGTKLES